MPNPLIDAVIARDGKDAYNEGLKQIQDNKAKKVAEAKEQAEIKHPAGLPHSTLNDAPESVRNQLEGKPLSPQQPSSQYGQPAIPKVQPFGGGVFNADDALASKDPYRMMTDKGQPIAQVGTKKEWKDSGVVQPYEVNPYKGKAVLPYSTKDLRDTYVTLQNDGRFLLDIRASKIEGANGSRDFSVENFKEVPQSKSQIDNYRILDSEGLSQSRKAMGKFYNVPASKLYGTPEAKAELDRRNAQIVAVKIVGLSNGDLSYNDFQALRRDILNGRGNVYSYNVADFIASKREQKGNILADHKAQGNAMLSSMKRLQSDREKATGKKDYYHPTNTPVPVGSMSTSDLADAHALVSMRMNRSLDMLDIVEKKARGKNGWFSNFGEGVGEGLANELVSSVSLGQRRGSDYLQKLIKRYNKGEKLNKEDSALLDAFAYSNTIDSEMVRHIPSSYKIGETTGASIPFMIDFLAANAVAGVGEIGAKVGAKLTQKTFQAMVRNGILDNSRGLTRFGAKLLGGVARVATDAGVAGVMTAVNPRQMGKIASDAYEMLEEKPLASTSRSGAPKFGGVTLAPQETSEVKAFAKSFTDQWIENWSEMAGGWLGGIGKGAKNFGKTIVGGAFNDVKKAVPQMMAKYGDNSIGVAFAQAAKEAASIGKKAGFNDLLSENVEEYFGSTARILILGGDHTWDKEFSPEQIKETFVGLLPTMLMFGAIGGVSTAGQHATSARQLKEYDDKLKARGIDTDKAREQMSNMSFNEYVQHEAALLTKARIKHAEAEVLFERKDAGANKAMEVAKEAEEKAMFALHFAQYQGVRGVDAEAREEAREAHEREVDRSIDDSVKSVSHLLSQEYNLDNTPNPTAGTYSRVEHNGKEYVVRNGKFKAVAQRDMESGAPIKDRNGNVSYEVDADELLYLQDANGNVVPVYSSDVTPLGETIRLDGLKNSAKSILMSDASGSIQPSAIIDESTLRELSDPNNNLPYVQAEPSAFVSSEDVEQAQSDIAGMEPQAEQQEQVPQGVPQIEGGVDDSTEASHEEESFVLNDDEEQEQGEWDNLDDYDPNRPIEVGDYVLFDSDGRGYVKTGVVSQVSDDAYYIQAHDGGMYVIPLDQGIWHNMFNRKGWTPKEHNTQEQESGVVDTTSPEEVVAEEKQEADPQTAEEWVAYFDGDIEAAINWIENTIHVLKKDLSKLEKESKQVNAGEAPSEYKARIQESRVVIDAIRAKIEENEGILSDLQSMLVDEEADEPQEETNKSEEVNEVEEEDVAPIEESEEEEENPDEETHIEEENIPEQSEAKEDIIATPKDDAVEEEEPSTQPSEEEELEPEIESETTETTISPTESEEKSQKEELEDEKTDGGQESKPSQDEGSNPETESKTASEVLDEVVAKNAKELEEKADVDDNKSEELPTQMKEKPTTKEVKKKGSKKELDSSVWAFTIKDPSRPILAGVYHDAGYAVATNMHVLIAEKAAYDPSKEGSIVDRKGNVIDAKFPGWRAIIPENLDSFNMDFWILVDKLREVRSKIEKEILADRGLSRISPKIKNEASGSVISVRFPNGVDLQFELGYMESFANAAVRLGITEMGMEKGQDCYRIFAQNKNGILGCVTIHLGRNTPSIESIDLENVAQEENNIERENLKEDEKGALYHRSGQIAIYDYSDEIDEKSNSSWQKWGDLVDSYNEQANDADKAYERGDTATLGFRTVDAAIKFNEWLNDGGRTEKQRSADELRNDTAAKQLATNAVLDALNSAGISVEVVSDETASEMLGENAAKADAFDEMDMPIAEKQIVYHGSPAEFERFDHEDDLKITDHVQFMRTGGKKKSAPETASPATQDHQTVVSSADGAKVLNELENLVKEYENSKGNKPNTFIGDVSKALGAKRQGSASEYASFETKSGKTVTIRLSNHNAKVSTFDAHHEAEGISIVVTPKENNGISNDGNAHVTEFYYNAIKLRRADGKPLVEILKSIKQALYSGVYTDNTGLAEVKEVNVPTASNGQTDSGKVYGWTVGGKIFLTKDGINPNTPIHEYTHLWANAMRQRNAEGWQSVKDLLKGTPIWNEVLKDPNYRSISGDEDAVASEALSRISGRENAKKMEAEAQRMIDEADGIGEQAEAVTLLDRMRRALDAFWHWTGKNLFGIKNFESIEEVTDRVLYDLTTGTDLQNDRSLMAVHNISVDKLQSALELGGFPMPSIAITNADMGHTEYGDISLVFARESIDPSDSRNKVYSGDAWTPTFPKIGYKLNDKKTNEIYKRANAVGSLPLFNPVYFYPDNYEREIDERGDASLVGRFKEDYGAKQMYLAEKGNAVREFVQHEVQKYSPENVSLYKKILETVGLERLKNESLDSVKNDLTTLGVSGKDFKYERTILAAIDYAKHGNSKIENDIDATKQEIDKRIDAKSFSSWLEELFSGVVEKKGIRNDRDMFTPSGSSRKWESLYDAVTLDNVIKSMRKQAEKGGEGFLNSSIFGASTKKLPSINAIRREAKLRINSIPDEKMEKAKGRIIDRLEKVSIPSVEKGVSDAFDFVENIIDAVSKSHTPSGIYKYLHTYYPDMTLDAAKEISDIVGDIQKMSARYFEAKPYRVVGFDEVRAAVIPNDVSQEVIDGLRKRGIKVVSYEKGNEQDRKDALSAVTHEMDIRFQIKGKSNFQRTDDVLSNEIEEIKRKAVEDNSFMKAPNGADTNLTERQWLQVRTKAFKNWFGDWEKKARIEKLRKSSPIVLQGNEYEGKYELNRDSAKAFIKDHLRKEYTNADTNDVILVAKEGAQKVTSHSMGSEAHLKSIVAIPQLIEQSIFIDELPNDKNNGKYVHYRYYVSGIKMGGVDYTAKIAVGIDAYGNKYYDHSLTEIEKGKLIDEVGALSPTLPSSNQSTLSAIKDTKLVSLLQVGEVSKVVDENGEPLVVYHGTWASRGDNYDKWYPSKEAPFYQFGESKYGGIHFGTEEQALWRISQKRDAFEWKGDYTGFDHVYESFLSIKNVLRVYDPGLEWREVISEAKSNGHDGLVYLNIHEGMYAKDSFVVFSPTQIKSATDNVGSFDGSVDDIRFRRSETPLRESDGDIFVRGQISPNLPENFQSYHFFYEPGLDYIYADPTEYYRLESIYNGNGGHLPEGWEYDFNPEDFRLKEGYVCCHWSDEYEYPSMQQGAGDDSYCVFFQGEEVAEVYDGVVARVVKKLDVWELQKDRTYKRVVLDAARYRSEENRSTKQIVSENGSAYDTLYDRAGVEQKAKSVVDKLSVPIDVKVKSKHEVPRSARNTKGYYDPKSGEVVVVLENVSSREDLEKTILHEVIGHKGLDALIPEADRDAFFNGVYNLLSEEQLLPIMARYPNAGKRELAEEFIAHLAEGYVHPTLITRVSKAIRGLLRSLGFNLRLTDGEVMTLLYRGSVALKRESATAAQEIAYINQDKAVSESMSYMDELNAMSLDELRDEVGENGVKLAQRMRLLESLGESERLRYRADEAFKEIEVENVDRSAVANSMNKAFTGKKVGEHKIPTWTQFLEETQDDLISLRKYQENVEKSTGKKLPSYLNIDKVFNQMSSRAAAAEELLVDIFEKEVGGVIRKLEKEKKITYRDIQLYVMAKHAIERNQVKRQKEIEKLSNPTSGDIARIMQQDFSSELDIQYGIEKHLKGSKNPIFSNVDGIRSYIEAIENSAGKDIDALWSSINKLNGEALKMWHEAGMISKDHYNNIKKLYKYYVPLQGIDDETIEDVWTYYGVSNRGNYSLVKDAEGRNKLPDNPFMIMRKSISNTAYMAEHNKAKIVVLALAQTHPTDYLIVRNSWDVLTTDANGREEWKEVMPESEEGAVTEESMIAFEEKMQALEEEGKAKRHEHEPISNIGGYRVSNRNTLEEHLIRVSVNGKEQVVFVNGSPSFSQAVNRENRGKEREFLSKVAMVTRLKAAFATSLSIPFAFTNGVRDLLWSLSSNGIRYGKDYEMRFVRYYGRAGKFLFSPEDKQDEGMKHLWDEFKRNGGRTGYASMVGDENARKLAQKGLSRGIGKRGVAARAVNKAGNAISYLGETIEDLTRFAAYCAAREGGKSVTDSIDVAKEMTVNFNRRGKGSSLFMRSIFSFYMFINANIQGMAQLVKMFKNHPVGTSVMAGAYAMLPMFSAILTKLIGDDDDYFALSDYERTHNLIICLGSGKFIKVPMPQEMYPFLAIGNSISELAFGESSVTDVLLGSVDGILDGATFGLDASSSSLKHFKRAVSKGEENPTYLLFRGFVPSILQPATDVWNNWDYVGRHIEKPSYGKNTPKYQRVYENKAWGWLVGLSKAINGDDIKGRAMQDDGIIGAINSPANAQYLIESWLGGVVSTIAKDVRFAEDLFRGENFFESASHAAVLGRFIHFDSHLQEKKMQSDFYKAKEEIGIAQKKINEIQKGIKANEEAISIYEEEGNYVMVGILEKEIEDAEADIMEITNGKDPELYKDASDMFKDYSKEQRQLRELLNSTTDEELRSEIQEQIYNSNEEIMGYYNELLSD